MVNKNLLEIAKRLGRTDLVSLPPPKNESDDTLSGEFSLEDKLDFWRFSNINYRNGVYQVDLAKNLLDNGNSKTQDDWIEYSKQAQRNSGFYIADFPLHFALKHALYSNRKSPPYKTLVNEAKEFIKKNMFDHWLLTSTKIQYKENGKDTIIHNYALPDQYEVQENFVESDGFITKPETNAQPALNALLNIAAITPKEVNDVYKWLTEKDAYLVRVNSKTDIERVAWFNAGSDRVFLDCCRGPRSSGPALGVRYAPQARAAK